MDQHRRAGQVPPSVVPSSTTRGRLLVTGGRHTPLLARAVEAIRTATPARDTSLWSHLPQPLSGRRAGKVGDRAKSGAVVPPRLPPFSSLPRT